MLSSAVGGGFQERPWDGEVPAAGGPGLHFLTFSDFHSCVYVFELLSATLLISLSSDYFTIDLIGLHSNVCTGSARARDSVCLSQGGHHGS